ncbi:MAG: hypothetical protein QME45_09080 [Clostridiales bacterium]|nr:hypothetical protein [Clostridiales bacterium]
MGSGGTAASMGISDVLEGVQDICYGSTGSETASTNLIRDYVYQGNYDVYYLTEIGSVMVALQGMAILGNVPKSEGAGKSANITNDVLKAPRAGSALKIDDYHAFNNIVDNYAGLATKTSINNGTLYQLEGSLNGVQGRFEWIIDSAGQYAGQVSHRYFVSGGTLNGVPIKP